MLGCLDVTVEHVYHVVGLRHILAYFVLDDFTLVVGVENLFLHHSVAHCCHLWTVLRVDDCSDDGASECRTNLHELVLVVLVDELVALLHLHVEVVDFELGAVGGQS